MRKSHADFTLSSNTNESCGYAPDSGVFGGAEESAKVRRFGWLARWV